MERGAIAALCLLIAMGVLAGVMGAYGAGRQATAVVVERQCLLVGGFKANGTDFKCERNDAPSR